MKLKPLQAAKLYFSLQPLSTQSLSFQTSYRIGRNLDHLKNIGEKFIEDLKQEFATVQDANQADFITSQKWSLLEDEEEFPLMKLDIEGEKELKISAIGIKELFPLLIVKDDLNQSSI
jgi:hypothetical protein